LIIRSCITLSLFFLQQKILKKPLLTPLDTPFATPSTPHGPNLTQSRILAKLSDVRATPAKLKRRAA
jgi:hypothetical protein